MTQTKKPRTKTGTTNFLHLELPTEEENTLKEMLKKMDLKGSQVLRMLIRRWMRLGGKLE